MRAPAGLAQARWHAKSARRGVARADKWLFKNDLYMADFELRHAAMEQANAAKVLSGDYPQPRLEGDVMACQCPCGMCAQGLHKRCWGNCDE